MPGHQKKRNLTAMLERARSGDAQARDGVVKELVRITQMGGDGDGLIAARALIELFQDGTLDLSMIHHLKAVGEEKVRSALACYLGSNLHLHVHQTGKGKKALDNLAWWYCGWGLPFESLHVSEPKLESRPATT